MTECIPSKLEAKRDGSAASLTFIRSWPLTLICALFLPLLLTLGFWQLQRGQEKSAINANIDARLSAQPVAPDKLKALQTYTPVRLLGYYTDQYFYLDNKTRNGSVGYEILQVFISGEQRWLINRGWVAAGNDRAKLPEVSWPLAAKVISGFLYPVPEAEQAGPELAQAARIQRVDTNVTASLQLAQPRWSIRLSADSDTALYTDWQLINSPPERHQAYAVQWFTMALALVLLWALAATNLRALLSRKMLDRKASGRNPKK